MKNILRAFCALFVLCVVACNEPVTPITPDVSIASLGTPADNEIWFTTSDNKELAHIDGTAFNAQITDIEYSEFGINIIHFDAPLTTIGAGAFDARGTSRNLYNISLPQSVEAIEERAFFECTNLECITLGSNIKHCGSQAFSNCGALTSIHITSLGDWAQIDFANGEANPLYYNGELILNGKKIKKELAIPTWTPRIGSNAFYNYNTISSVTIPANVKSIGKDAFYGCDGLTKVTTTDIAAWCNIYFENIYSNPLTMASSLYIGDKAATTISLQGIEEVKALVFQGCNNVTSVVADDTLKTIGAEAFRGCFKLQQVSLGSNVSSIEGRAFMACTALKSVTIKATTPPTLGNDNVFDYNAEGRKIYVPAEAYDSYIAAPMWSEYADNIEALK